MTGLRKNFSPGRGYTKADWDEVSGDSDATDEELAQARSFAEAFPELAESIRKRGPVKTKEAVSIRLDQDLLTKLRASGPGWQSRVNDALRRWIETDAA